MNFLSIIFRSGAILGALGAFAFYYFNSHMLESRESELVKIRKNRDSVVTILEKDKNQSTNLLNGLFRERGKIRLEREESLANSESLNGEASFLIPQKEKLEEVNSKLNAEFLTVSKQIAEEKRKLEDAKTESNPLVQEESQIKVEVEGLKEELKVVQTKRNSLNTDLSALSKRREVAREVYQNEREKILQEIQIPPHIYYGDKREILIDNVAPSGKGFFSVGGLSEGFRENMTFLCLDENEINSPLVRIRSKLVQDNLIFFEFTDPFSVEKSEIIQSNKKLFLIRTGESNTN